MNVHIGDLYTDKDFSNTLILILHIESEFESKFVTRPIAYTTYSNVNSDRMQIEKNVIFLDDVLIAKVE